MEQAPRAPGHLLPHPSPPWRTHYPCPGVQGYRDTGSAVGTGPRLPGTHLAGSTGAPHDGRCFQVLTKAVGMSE